MLGNIFTNKKILTILMALLLLFSIVGGLRYMNLYEGLEGGVGGDDSSPNSGVAPTTKQNVATVYAF